MASARVNSSWFGTSRVALLAVGEHPHAVSSVAWNPESLGDDMTIPTPESERVLATGSEDGVATLWDLDARKGPDPIEQAHPRSHTQTATPDATQSRRAPGRIRLRGTTIDGPL